MRKRRRGGGRERGGGGREGDGSTFGKPRQSFHC